MRTGEESQEEGRGRTKCLFHVLGKISISLSKKQGGGPLFPGPGDTATEPGAEATGDSVSPEAIRQL